MKLSTIVAVGWCMVGGARASVGDPDESSLTPPGLRTSRRHTQSAGDAKLVKLRWMDAGTDQPMPWRDISLDGSYPIDVILDRDVPSGGISMEAVVESSAPVGSVKFEWTSDPERLSFIENKAPYLMCGNIGTNILPCQNLVPARYPNITIWSEPNAKGTKLYENMVFSTMDLLVEPYVKWFDLVDNTTILRERFYESQISLSEHPKISFLLRYEPYDIPSWLPKSALFNLDKGAMVRLDKTEPFTMLGNTGMSFFNTYTPTLGKHTLTVTAYREENGKGQSFNLTVDFFIVP